MDRGLVGQSGAPQVVVELDADELGAQQITSLHREVEQVGAIDGAERQIAADEPRLSQLTKCEHGAGRRCLVGKDAIFEGRIAELYVREAASNEAAARELRALE